MGINLLEGVDFNFGIDFLEKLTEKQREAFHLFSDKFQKLFEKNESEVDSADIPDEATKLRFLQADDYKVDQAIERLISCIQWRTKDAVSKMLENAPPEHYQTYLENRITRHIGFDKEGRPIIAERFGETMSGKNLNVMPIEEWIKCIVYDTELLCKTLNATSKKHGKPIQTVLNIYDLKGISAIESMRNISFLKQVDAALSTNYPELVSVLLVVNAPSFISGVYNKIVKRFLDPVTVSKVRIHSNVPLKLLEEFAEIEQLPVEYGGKNTFNSDYPHRSGFK